MTDQVFNTPAGQTIARELLVAYLNTGTASTPVWSIIGKRVEESSLEFDWSKETKKDILGDTYTSLKKPTITQTFEPCELDAGDAAQELIWNKAIKDQNAMALASMDMLIVHLYADDGATQPSDPFAERYKACAIEVTSEGGAGGGAIGMPIEVTYGGTREIGTAAVDSTGAVTFTKAT